MTKRKLRQIVYIVLIAVLAVIFALSAFMIIRYYVGSNEAKREFEQLSGLVPEREPATVTEAQTASERYAGLYAQNNDFIGWLSIEGTNIDYPVMQTKDDEQYYLRRGFDKAYSYHGVPFMDDDCVVGVSDNIIIYGHNMMDNTMFSALEKYKSKSFYEEHKYINFDSLWEYGTYEIIAVIRSTPETEKEFRYYGMANAWSEEHFNEYVSQLKARSLYSTDATAVYGDELITLSTCEYSVDNGRFAVIAKKI